MQIRIATFVSYASPLQSEPVWFETREIQTGASVLMSVPDFLISTFAFPLSA